MAAALPRDGAVMAGDFDIQVNAAAVDRAMAEAPRLLHKELRSAMYHRMGKPFRRAVAKNFASSSPDKQRQAEYFVLSQVHHYTKGTRLQALELGIFSRSEKLAAHEKGATITARGGGSLAIPFADAVTEKGRTRLKYRSSTNSPTNVKSRTYGAFDLRSIPGATVIKVRGKLYAVIKETEDDGWESITAWLARLVKSVTLKPKLGFFATWDRLAPERVRVLNKVAEDVVRYLERIKK